MRRILKLLPFSALIRTTFCWKSIEVHFRRELPKVLIFIRCPCCGLWRFIGKIETYSIWDILVDGFDVPFEVDYRAGGGRAKGWTSRVRKNRLPKSMKDNYLRFLSKIKSSKELKEIILEEANDT